MDIDAVAAQPFVPSLWICKGKKYPEDSLTVTNAIIVERTRLLTIPAAYAALLPSCEIS